MISVVVPVYNVDEYLSECISSIVNQSYSHLEIILVDDGSMDHSGDICDRWAQKDSRIKVIHQKHTGVSEARNAGIRASTGELIGFVDADDWLESNMYQVMAERIAESDADAAMCGFFYFQKGFNKPRGIPAIVTETFEDHAVMVLKKNGYYTSLWNKLFRRECVFRKDKKILMDPELSYGEDEVWLYEVLQGCRRICYVHEALYHYRVREGSLSTKRTLSKEYMSLVNAKDKALELLPSFGHARSRFMIINYRNMLKFRMIGYITKDKSYSQIIKKHLRLYRPEWLRSKDIKKKEKHFAILLEIFMTIGMPVIVIIKISNRWVMPIG